MRRRRGVFLAELSDTLDLRHEILQTLEQLIQLRLLGKHLFNKRSAIRNVIGERSFAVRQRIVKRDGRVVAEFAIEAVAVAQSPFAARTEALVAILHAFLRQREKRGFGMNCKVITICPA